MMGILGVAMLLSLQGAAGGAQAKPATGAAGTPSASGSAADSAVPLRYRRRVADYFQRIIDEAHGK